MDGTQTSTNCAQMVVRRIDLHHHFFPSTLDKLKKNAKMGWRTPAENLPWSPEISLKSMDALQVDVAILSLPPSSAGAIGPENRRSVRGHNDLVSSVCKRYPDRFGFFATLPFLDDTKGALAEITYAFDELKADGIVLTSSYGEGSNATYIGDDRYDPIWEELNKRRSVVFLHGAQTASSTPHPHPFLGIPITEVPNETFKAAAHLVVTAKKRKFCNVKIVLAHLGGSTPFLAARVAVLSKHMGCTLSHDEILHDFKSFYYETALSAYEPTLAAMERFVPPDQILFGTDFPAVSSGMAEWYTRNLEEFYVRNFDELCSVMHRNALKLFPRLRGLSPDVRVGETPDPERPQVTARL